MINLLASIVDRALERAPVLQPRERSVFEPVNDAALTRHEDAGDSLPEDEMFAERAAAVRQEPPNEVDKEPIDKPRSISRVHRNPSEDTARLSQLVYMNEDEPKPQQRQAATHKVDQQDNSSIREESLVRDATDRDKSYRQKSPLPGPSIETIVERKLEREVVLINRDDKHRIEETSLVAQAPQNSQQPATNDVIARRPHKEKQSSAQIDETVLLKPAEQRRAPRQETMRSVPTRSESEPAQRAGPVTPTISVTIGRVEVRATATSKRADSRRPASPRLSLEDYLQARSKGN